MAGARRAGRAGIAGWVLFDWATQPVYTLVLTFLFAPYFANVFLADPVHGQAVWGYLVAAAGLAVALASPPLGAVADATGRRKSWIAAFSLLLVAGLGLLWFAEANDEAHLALVGIGVVIALIAVELATVFNNAMMTRLVPEGRLGRLSGTGWAVGYLGGLASLGFAMTALIAEAETGLTLIGTPPLLPLDPATHEGERAIGPFAALWYVLFALPFFLFTPDVGGRGVSAGAAMRDGWRHLRSTLAGLGARAMLARFLLARMLYADGLAAIFTFGGLYAASVFAWSATDLGLFGILLTIAGAVGAVIGGRLDDRLGPRLVILVSLGGLIAAALGILSVDSRHVLFFLEVPEARTGGGGFASTSERAMLGFAVLLGLVSGPLQSASRSFLARLAPADMQTEAFGLYAFSGKVTAFAAPALVGAATAWSGSQRIGIATIGLFLIAGLGLMWTVREPTP